jgi:hypothetical protein
VGVVDLGEHRAPLSRLGQQAEGRSQQLVQAGEGQLGL